MAIKNIKITNSRIGIHTRDINKVMQFVTIKIFYTESGKVHKTIDIGLRKKTTLSFLNTTYFGTLSDKKLELWDEHGKLLKAMSMPKGQIIDVFNDWFIILYNQIAYAYDKTGTIVAKGNVNENNDNIQLSKIEKPIN